MNFVGSESLRASALCQNSFVAHSEAKKTGLCNHDPIVDAKSLISRENLSTALLCHDSHHFLKTFIATYTAHY